MDENITKGMLLNDAGYNAIDNNDYNKAIYLLQRSVILCNEIDDWEGESTALCNLSKAWFCKWEEKQRDYTRLDKEALGGPLANGMRALSREVKLCIEHDDKKGAFVTINDVYRRLRDHAGLPDEEALYVFSKFQELYILPTMRRMGIHLLSDDNGNHIRDLSIEF